MAAAAVGLVWLFERWREGRRRRLAAESEEQTPVEIRGFPPIRPKNGEWMGHGRILPDHAQRTIHWGWLYLTALLSALCHLLLDWANNYGLRPFFPFNPRWYAGSFVFIAEPVLWALLLAALVIPGVLGLADREIGARRVRFRGRAWAIFALSGMVVLWCVRWAEHAQALAMLSNTQITAEPIKRVAIEPYPVSLFRWHAIIE